MLPLDNATQGSLKRLSVRLSGIYAAIAHTHGAADIVSGLIATARLGSGTANGTTFLAGDQTYKTVSVPSASYLAAVPWRSGRWYESQYCGFGIASTVPVLGTVYYTPIYVPAAGTISDVGINVATGQASTAVHFGLYADSSGVPGSLLTNFGNAASTSAGVKSIGSLGYAIQPGLYWLAFMSLGGTTQPTCSFHASPGATPNYAGSAAPSDAQLIGYNQTGQSSLPATASTLTTVTSINRPRVMLKWT